MSRKELALPLIVLTLVSLTYLNHFQGEFQFDDLHAVVDNPAIRTLSNIPRFFTNSRLFSPYATNQAYRPLTSVTLTIDYWMGGGLVPFYFHLSTFLAYLILLLSLAALLKQLCGDSRRAWLVTALFGVHPVCAQTVNYICQRSEVYVALGLVLATLFYARGRPWLSMVPYFFACLAKQNGIVFPALIVMYELFLGKKRFGRVLPFVAVAGLYLAIMFQATSENFAVGSSEPQRYILSQPYVLMTYLRNCFWAGSLVGDSDMVALHPLEARAVIGYFGLLVYFVCMALARGTVGFGMSWFLVAQAPTLLVPLDDVTNDHRMFVPYIGLAIVLCHMASSKVSQYLLILTTPLLVWATIGRNEVWRTQESFWREVTIKCPRSGRGWMNYGLSQYWLDRNEAALQAFRRAEPLLPSDYSPIFLNYGEALAALGRHKEAEAYFRHGVEVDPGATPLYVYGSYLADQERIVDAYRVLKRAQEVGPTDTRSQERLKQFFHQLNSRAYASQTSTAYLKVALLCYLDQDYKSALKAIDYAIKLNPNDATAYSDAAACYLALGDWGQALQAAEKAVQLDPASLIAQENLKKARYHGSGKKL
ncbi:MAG: tetratricopeptide repeat protein [Candidatus Eremiobacteraeota bacterium]|nr:tetratricopeptide repeat protein [Candidatus Eremiobacteraeota bacterium]